MPPHRTNEARRSGCWNTKTVMCGNNPQISECGNTLSIPPRWAVPSRWETLDTAYLMHHEAKQCALVQTGNRRCGYFRQLLFCNLPNWSCSPPHSFIAMHKDARLGRQLPTHHLTRTFVLVPLVTCTPTSRSSAAAQGSIIIMPSSILLLHLQMRGYGERRSQVRPHAQAPSCRRCYPIEQASNGRRIGGSRDLDNLPTEYVIATCYSTFRWWVVSQVHALPSLRKWSQKGDERRPGRPAAVVSSPEGCDAPQSRNYCNDKVHVFHTLDADRLQ